MFGVTYSASKTAINAITLSFAADLESTGIKVNAACPGFTSTDLNNFEGTRTVEQAARRARASRARRRERSDGHVLERGRPAAVVM
jgi:NAD(P)-dependent dehydrogenase (short-subunit alcohol dehydrogenase family)